MEKARDNSSMGFGNNQKQTTVLFWKHKKTIDGYMPPQECKARTKIAEILRLSRTQKRQCVIARLPAACTCVKLEDAPLFFKIPKSDCPDVWIRLPRHKWPKSWEKMKILWYLLKTFFQASLCRIAMGLQIRTNFIRSWVGENSELGMFIHSELSSFLSVYVDVIRMVEKNKLWLPFVGGLQHHSVVLYIDLRLFLCRLTSLTENFASCAAHFARCNMSFSFVTSARYFPSRVLMTFVSLCHARGRHHGCEFCCTVFLLDEASCECLHSCSCFFFDLASYLVVSGHASTQTCVH